MVLLDVIYKGKTTARRVARAHVLLRAAAGATDEEIAETLHLGLSTVHRTRQRFVDEGLTAALSERSRSGSPPVLTGKQAAISNGPGVQYPADGPPALDVAALGRSFCGTAPNRPDFPGYGRSRAQKNDLKPWKERQLSCFILSASVRDLAARLVRTRDRSIGPPSGGRSGTRNASLPGSESTAAAFGRARSSVGPGRSRSPVRTTMRVAWSVIVT